MSRKSYSINDFTKDLIRICKDFVLRCTDIAGLNQRRVYLEISKTEREFRQIRQKA